MVFYHVTVKPHRGKKFSIGPYTEHELRLVIFNRINTYKWLRVEKVAPA